MHTIRTLAFLAILAASLAVAAPALAVAPENDAFAQAIELSGDSDETLSSNVDATKEIGEPAHAGNAGGASVWYRWTAERAGRAVLWSCESDFETLLAVYTGSGVAALTHVASTSECDDIEFDATPGVEYHIAIDGVDGATGEFFLLLFQRPANDDRANAQPIVGESGTAVVSNANATLEPGEAEHGGPGGASVWFRWTAPSSGPARFDTCTTGYDTLLAAYEGASTTPLATNDDHHCGRGSMIGFTAEAGKEYLIAVDGYEGGWIQGPLRWSRSLTEPLNVARPAVSGTPQEGATVAASDGAWTGSLPMSFSYAWARCNLEATLCEFIPGADGRHLALTAADVTFRIRVFVTATNGAGSRQMNSAATAPVAPRAHAAPLNTGSPTISGTPVEGGVLTGAAGTWDGYPPPTFSFQWESCSAAGTRCTEIPGEVEPALRLSPGEVRRRIRLTVVAANAAGSAAAHSDLTGVVTRARGQARCVVPNVRGKNLRAARAQIVRNRCRVGRVQRRFASARQGRVIAQTPRAGRRLTAWARVHLVVSKGRRR